MKKNTLAQAAIVMMVSTLDSWSATSNPNAIIQAKQLLQYPVYISGQKILSGQESMFNAGAFQATRQKKS